MGRRYGLGKGERAKGKGQRGKGKGQRGKGKGERAKRKGFKYIQIPLTFSQTTREVHTAYPNRIGGGGEMSFSPMPHALCPILRLRSVQVPNNQLWFPPKNALLLVNGNSGFCSFGFVDVF